MYIRKITEANPSVFIAPVSTVLKPVVVEADMTWNAQVKSLSFHDNGVDHSEMNTIRKPIMKSAGSISNTSFV